MKLLTIISFFCFSFVFAQNYNYAVGSRQDASNNNSVIIIPLDFDWSNIPAHYSSSIWEIRYYFDLRYQTILLPENVTIRFNNGTLANGTIRGNKTTIESISEKKIFESLSLEGLFRNEFFKPYWFGAVMDGVTDDRNAFVETLKQATNTSAKVLIENDMFLDVKKTGKKSIFLEDYTWIEGTEGVQVIINNLLSPAFQMALTKNITIKNIIFLYDQTYDAFFGWNSQSNTVNTVQLKKYLSNTKNIKFSSSSVNPIWKGPILFRSVFLLSAARDIKFENISFKAKGSTANKFIQWAIKLKEEYNANQTITKNSGKTNIPRNVTLKNITMDGVIMGIQGIVDGFKCEGLTSYRYSDVQTSSGNYIGGSGSGGRYWMPPPHLFYLNSDNSKKFHTKNVQILNTMDHGSYVGNLNVRATKSGYCNSLKLVDNIENVTVDNYTSFRRDGIADIGDITNGAFSNMYSESNSSIFDRNFSYRALRFLGTLKNTTFEVLVIKDNSEVARIYPLDVMDGDYVRMDNVHVHVNELTSGAHGPFGIDGSYNRVVNSSLTIRNHTAKQPNRAIVFIDAATRKTNTNNHYEIKVNGWRSISNNTAENTIEILLQDSSNRNSNYAKITDLRNNFVNEQTNTKIKKSWIRKEIVTLGKGNKQFLKMNIPKYFKVDKITANILEDLSTDISASINYWSSNSTSVLLNNLSNNNKKTSQTTQEFSLKNANRPIYVTANKNFQNKGKIELIVELVKTQEAN